MHAGGNAVDAALGALLAAFTCEPVLTSLGAGGYMLVIPPEGEPVVLDFFVDAPGHGLETERRITATMDAVDVSFGDAVQRFHGGPGSAGVYGMPAGIVEASRRYGELPLAALTGPAAELARTGEPLSAEQAHIVEIVSGLVTLTPEVAALFAPAGRLLLAGEVYRDPALGEALDLLGAQGSDPFYTGAVAEAVVSWLEQHGGLVTAEDLANYRVSTRDPVRTFFRGREVLTNPPSSAGGVLIARMLQHLDRMAAPISAPQLITAMEEVQALRTDGFLQELNDDGFATRFLADHQADASADAEGGAGGLLGSTTHIATMDADGLACSVTTSNGSSSGVVIPATGIHINNMLGEQDLNPQGFHRHPAGRRLPSMMAPTAVLRDGTPELVLGSAGSNRIRSAIIQTILRVIDDGMTAADAVLAPRLHYEDGVLYTEPGAVPEGVDTGRHEVVNFSHRNLFFGGAQAVQRDRGGRFWGGGDPRRGGAAVLVTIG